MTFDLSRLIELGVLLAVANLAIGLFIAVKLTKGEQKIMAGVVDVTSEYTTLHQDLVAENGLIKQILVAVANGNLSSAAAQALVDGMAADDADAKSNAAAITAALAPPPPTPTPTPAPTPTGGTPPTV